MQRETAKERLVRKFKSEPLIPLGCFATAVILIGGLRSFRVAAPAATQQRFMRARVLAQAATLSVVAYGSFLAAKDSRESTADK